MAFVEVVRRSMRPEEWTDLRYAWIKRSLVSRQHEITDQCFDGGAQLAFTAIDHH